MKYRVVTRSRGGYLIQRWWYPIWVNIDGPPFSMKYDAISVAERLSNPKPIEVVWESK